MKATATGDTRWTFSVGNVPSGTTGAEPQFTSRDEICILNTGPDDATIEVTVYHTDSDPVGPYVIEVEGQRVCHVRVNDLIDPRAVPLGKPYGLVCTSDVAVVIQLSRLDTRRAALATSMISGVPGSR